MAVSPVNSVLFVCFGNICRSPIAEAIFRKLLEERSMLDKWKVDSAGVGTWFIGSPPDPRAIAVLRNGKYSINHTARQVVDEDFFKFEFMLASDDDTLMDLRRMEPQGSKSKIELLGTYDPLGDLYLDDPYFTKGEQTFNKTMDHCKRCCEGFFKKMVYRKIQQ